MRERKKKTMSTKKNLQRKKSKYMCSVGFYWGWGFRAPFR